MSATRIALTRGTMVTRLSNLPAGNHWAIVTEGTFHEDTGWGDSTATSAIYYQAYDTREAWEEAIQVRETSTRAEDRKYRAFEVLSATVQRHVTVSVETSPS